MAAAGTVGTGTVVSGMVDAVAEGTVATPTGTATGTVASGTVVAVAVATWSGTVVTASGTVLTKKVLEFAQRDLDSGRQFEHGRLANAQ